MDRIGNIIKKSRISKNLTLDDIAKELKISTDILKKIENDEIIPDKDSVYYIGHVKSVSELLNLNTQEVVEKFKNQIFFKKIDIVTDIAKPNFDSKYIHFQKYLPTALISVIFISFYFLFIRNDNETRNYALVPDLPEIYIPIIEQTNIEQINNTKDIEENNILSDENKLKNYHVIASDKIDVIDNNDTITLKMLNPTWIQIRDKNNDVILSKLMNKDEEFSYLMSLEYNLTAGNAGNILVLINKDVRGKIGKYGEIVDAIILDNNFNN